MQTYTHYKESGIDWIGQIPEHWLLIPNKFIFRLKKNQVGKRSSEYDLLSLTLRGIIKRDMENPEGKFPAEFDTYQEVKVNDFVFCLFDVEETPRTVGLSTYDGMITGAYTVMEPIGKNFAPYLYYYYLNADDKKQLKFLYRGLRNTIPKDSFFSLKTALPPIHEQEAIANFLDEKTAKIDALVQTKEQQIEKLKELRQAKIHQAVTKGLDANAPTQDSGIEWIGEIPAHWEVKRFANSFSLGKGLTITKEYLRDEGIFCLNYGEIHSKYGFEVSPEIHPLRCVDAEYLKTSSSSLLEKGDFVFADTSEDLKGSGNFTYLRSNIKTFAGYHTVIAKPNKDLNSRFLAYEFDSAKFRSQIQSKVKGVKVFSITQTLLKTLFIWLPTIQEQEQIVAYLDEVTGKIDQAIAQKQEQITKLKEYKQSLINDVVTGKVKVC